MKLIADNGTQIFTQETADNMGYWLDDDHTTFVIMTPMEVAEYSNCKKLTDAELKALGVSPGVDYFKGNSKHYTRTSWDAEHDGQTDKNKEDMQTMHIPKKLLKIGF